MKKINRIISIALAALMLTVCLAVLSGCGSKQKYVETPENNALYSFEEVRELNGNSKLPVLLGTDRSEMSGGYEKFGGSDNHYETHRSKDNKYVAYYLSTLDYHYNTNDQADTIYTVGVRISPENMEIKKNSDGTTYAVYTTSWNVLGFKIGDKIDKADSILTSYGYESLFKEEWTTSLPKTLEYTYRKGIIVITLGVESDSMVVSQMYVWIPYRTENIDAFNSECNLPANLGFAYSVYANPNFSQDKSANTKAERVYKSNDGSVAKLRGFPDYSDMGMTAYVSLTSSNYNVLGISVGTSISDAASKLTGLGWEADDTGLCFKNDIFLITFNGGKTSDTDAINLIEVELIESTNISGIEVD